MATQNKTATTSWVSLGAGPMLVALEVGEVAELHIAASMPAASAAVQRLVRGTDRESRTYNGTDNVYVKKSAAAVGDVIVSYGE